MMRTQTYRQVVRRARTIGYERSYRGWRSALADLIDATPGARWGIKTMIFYGVDRRATVAECAALRAVGIDPLDAPRWPARRRGAGRWLVLDRQRINARSGRSSLDTMNM